MYKSCQVVLLSTNEKATIGYLTAKGKKFKDLRVFDKKMPIILDSENFHLYIISDDEIEKGNYWFDGTNIRNDYSLHKIDGFDKKVMATTNNSLLALFGQSEEGFGKMKDGLPQIPKQFIEHYVSEYNKGNVITKVMIEFEQPFPNNASIFDCLKLNQDNTINIKLVKDNWNKEEVADLIRKSYFQATNKSTGHPDGFCSKFIEKNL